MKKDLIIIHGVTGAIGSACLTYFASQENIVVYGISRKAVSYKKFCKDGKLPPKTLICSLEGQSVEDTYTGRLVYYFTNAINPDLFNKVVYIHALGIYPFEIDKNGNRFVQCDNDMDGIDDRCELLTFDFFREFFAVHPVKGMHSFLFGSLADEYKPLAHASSWKTILKTKEKIKEVFEKVTNEEFKPCRVSLVNISSVLCPNELINRPFVFSATDADPRFWLQPTEISVFIESIIKIGQSEYFKEYSLFKKADYFIPDYYEHENFTPRKIAELYNQISSQLN